MTNRYVDVVITRQTKAVTQEGFGMPLILSTDKAAPYKIFEDVAAIGTEYGTSSNTYKLASALFGQTPRPAKVAVYGVTFADVDPVDELTAALNELVKTNNDFFFVHCTDQTDAVINALSAWIDTVEKLYFTSTSNEDLPGTLDSVNTIILVHDKPEQYPAAAWVGVCAPQIVGSYTWTFKTLNGITPSAYDSTTVNDIEANNASAYITEGGVNITSKGITTGGEYIDVIEGQYFIKSTMVANVFGLLANTPKVPYTDAGISLIVAEVEKALKQGAAQGIIATDADGNALYTIDAPSRADIPTNDVANRVLPDINWSATIAGAVEKVKINGVLQL